MVSVSCIAKDSGFHETKQNAIDRAKRPSNAKENTLQTSHPYLSANVQVTGRSTPEPPPSASILKTAQAERLASRVSLDSFTPALLLNATSSAASTSMLSLNSALSPGDKLPRPVPSHFNHAGLLSPVRWKLPRTPPVLLTTITAVNQLTPFRKVSTKVGGSTSIRAKGADTNAAAACALRGLIGSASISRSGIASSAAHLIEVLKRALTVAGE